MPVSCSTMLATITIALLSQFLVCPPLAHAVDIVHPTIKHAPISKKAATAGLKEIRATVTDDVAVKEVRLYYRTLGSKNGYVGITMMRELDGNVYVAKLPEISSPGIEYYIWASDSSGNPKTSGTKSTPIKVAIESGEKPPSVLVMPSPDEKGISKWVWIGLGAVAVGALAGGGGGGDTGNPTATVNITAPVP